MILQRIGRIALPPWISFAIAGIAVSSALLLGLLIRPSSLPQIKVAFIGNSMMYYNDFPRLMQVLSNGHLEQDSCLHGRADLQTILVWGNGMYQMWQNGNARLSNDDYTDGALFDFGACTVPQLLLGYDADLEQRVQNNNNNNDDNMELEYGDDYFSYNDGNNPCLRNSYYYNYRQARYQQYGAPQYDFVVMNDNTRNPARTNGRQTGLQVLEETYVAWFLETGAIPVFLATYAYASPYRDMGGLTSIPQYTVLTAHGYDEYAALLESYLPATQKPRIAPVGMAFLTVWEENYAMWQKLFHIDQVHASPLGSYLQACVVYHALFDEMPQPTVAIRHDMFELWLQARRMQPDNHRRMPFPTQQQAAYLYHVAKRVVVQGHVPQSFREHVNEEIVDYDPMDDYFRVDDLF